MRQGERPVIVYFHGNGGHIGYRADRVERFAREGYGVLMLEYRGYGGNPGMPSEAGLFEDAAAALRFVAAQGVPGHRLVLYGESLGTGIAVQAATTREVGAVVLESPYTSIAAAAQFHYPFIPAAWLVSDRYDSLSRIGQVRAPILMLHGDARRRHPVEPRLRRCSLPLRSRRSNGSRLMPVTPISAGSVRSISPLRSSSGTSGKPSPRLRAEPIDPAAAVARRARTV